tara:strand:+ start:554 stop:1036 length:483 start_codon:yes stop_codon:yes gene_type:complete
MASKVKMFKNISFEYILGIVAILILCFAIYNYSQNKSLTKSGFAPVNTQPEQIIQQTGQSNVPSRSVSQPTNSPNDLLPSTNNNNSEFNNFLPTKGLENVGLLSATHRNGINTIGSTLRNANLQIRSEPPNPRNNTNCPWNQSTIEPDTKRKSLEIGQSI